jgi:hypothetical protein
MTSSAFEVWASWPDRRLLKAAFYVVTLAAAAGAVLALLHLRGTEAGSRPPAWAGIAHGGVGAVGLALMVPVLLGPPRGTAAGAASFGPIAAWLLGGALVSGAAVLLRRRNGPTVTIAVHAGIAITGYVMLLAWYSVG